jgi:hypothetical protein
MKAALFLRKQKIGVFSLSVVQPQSEQRCNYGKAAAKSTTTF